MSNKKDNDDMAQQEDAQLQAQLNQEQAEEEARKRQLQQERLRAMRNANSGNSLFDAPNDLFTTIG